MGLRDGEEHCKTEIIKKMGGLDGMGEGWRDAEVGGWGGGVDVMEG